MVEKIGKNSYNRKGNYSMPHSGRMEEQDHGREDSHKKSWQE